MISVLRYLVFFKQKTAYEIYQCDWSSDVYSSDLTGAAGPAGPQGPADPAGANGKDGANGAPGEDGKSVVAQPASGCAEGGTEFEVEGSGVAEEGCNGGEGPQGPKGDPWVVGAAPSGTLLKGTWAIQQYTAAGPEEKIPVPFSTGVPITADKDKPLIPVFKLGAAAAVESPTLPGGPYCLGDADNPTVTPPTLPFGVVCAYAATGSYLNLIPPTVFETSVSGGGAIGRPMSEAAGTVTARGTWAMITP